MKNTKYLKKSGLLVLAAAFGSFGAFAQNSDPFALPADYSAITIGGNAQLNGVVNGNFGTSGSQIFSGSGGIVNGNVAFENGGTYVPNGGTITGAVQQNDAEIGTIIGLITGNSLNYGAVGGNSIGNVNGSETIPYSAGLYSSTYNASFFTVNGLSLNAGQTLTFGGAPGQIDVLNILGNAEFGNIDVAPGVHLLINDDQSSGVIQFGGLVEADVYAPYLTSVSVNSGADILQAIVAGNFDASSGSTIGCLPDMPVLPEEATVALIVFGVIFIVGNLFWKFWAQICDFTYFLGERMHRFLPAHLQFIPGQIGWFQ